MMCLQSASQITSTITVNCYSNSHPWVTKDIKATLNAKKRAFRAGNREEVRTIQGDLKVKIREAKEKYRKCKLNPFNRCDTAHPPLDSSVVCLQPVAF